MKLNLHNIKLLMYIIGLLGFVPISAQHGPSAKAFSEIVLGGNYVWNSSIGDLNEYWSSDHGIDGFIQTPFYAGDIKIGFTYIPFEGKDAYHPDFNSYYINLGWGENLHFTDNISMNVGAKIGSFMMSFQDDTLSVFRTQESEIGLAAEAGLKFGVTSHIDINISANFLSVFTSRRIKLFSLYAGVSYAFRSPKWMREIVE
jgi:hypothetical protein